MSEIPASWNLTPKPRPDGKVDIVGKDDAGSEYVARTTEEAGVTERDLEILKVGNREASTAHDFVEFYAGERRRYKQNWERSQDDAWADGAERVVAAGLHTSESKVGYSRAYARGWEKAFGGVN